MNENKEEIRYILKFYYKKGKNAKAAKKCVMFMMQYQHVWHKAGSKRFQSGNFDIKDAPRFD